MVKVLQLALEVGNCTPQQAEFNEKMEYVLIAELSKFVFMQLGNSLQRLPSKVRNQESSVSGPNCLLGSTNYLKITFHQYCFFY